MPDWEHPDRQQALERTRQIMGDEPIPIDPQTGHMRNPAGATGVTGFGRLRLLGANPTADMIVTSDNKALLIQRNDTGQLAPPGGFADSLPDGEIESSLDNAVRELAEETGIRIAVNGSATPEALAQADLVIEAAEAPMVARGVAAVSLRNTDEAWIYSTAHHLHVPRDVGRLLVPQGRDDANPAGTGWYDLATVDRARLSDKHAEYIDMLRSRLGIRPRS